MAITLGLEEEVFLTQPTLPTFMSFLPLVRLMWASPRRHFLRTASNFARGKDARQVLMGAVEVSTGVARDVPELLEDLKQRRGELASRAASLCVPVGNLFDLTCPTNTAGLHVHLGNLPDPPAAYRRVAKYLPLVMRYGAHAPVAGGVAAPPSWRMAHGYAIGALDGSYTHRFQDLILAKRLGTLEVRVLDPHWSLAHYGALVRLLRDIAALEEDPPLDLGNYSRLRQQALSPDGGEALSRLEEELAQQVDLPWRLGGPLAFQQTLDWFNQRGVLETYQLLDGGFRSGVPQVLDTTVSGHRYARALGAWVGYYLPRLPYIAYKAWREN